MIYLDNAATGWPKPEEVRQSVMFALENFGNPGRGGHILGLNADNALYECRCKAAKLFGVSEEERVVFTMNATHALNIAIRNAAKDGGHFVISGYEHNSVVRPLENLKNISYSVAHSKVFDEEDAFEQITAKVREDTVCIILNHVSNVFGNMMPIEKIDEFCSRKRIDLILDASQSAGNIDIDVSKLKSLRYVCMPGHKGLNGPSGTGILICCKGDRHYGIMQGGTGSESQNFMQPIYLPDALESGTSNFVGIAGLAAGIDFVLKNKCSEINRHKSELINYLAENFPDNKKLKLFYDIRQHSLISFTGFENNDLIFEELCRRDICVRSGLHCSPLAHKSAGTSEHGAIRLSFSPFNDMDDIKMFLKNLKNILKLI